ncbi:YndM family protein [Bacillus sp. REN3]|uniref:YndM family protein n=1 Tax=Bacillus sp. REN3 TaxID=2802440 RepID=UPI001AEF342E|nr:YndM family protein [Bacillus sp. REN3]
MEHVKALLIKGIMTLAILFLVLGLEYDAGAGDLLLITLVLGAVSYLAGDLFILPRTSNRTATLSDFVLSFLVVWGMGLMLFGQTDNLMAGALFTAFLIAGGEWFFHSYMANDVLYINRKI